MSKETSSSTKKNDLLNKVNSLLKELQLEVSVNNERVEDATGVELALPLVVSPSLDTKSDWYDSGCEWYDSGCED